MEGVGKDWRHGRCWQGFEDMEGFLRTKTRLKSFLYTFFMYPAEREGGKKRMRKERIPLNKNNLCSTKRAGSKQPLTVRDIKERSLVGMLRQTSADRCNL
jgi:hypothetical protein